MTRMTAQLTIPSASRQRPLTHQHWTWASGCKEHLGSSTVVAMDRKGVSYRW